MTTYEIIRRGGAVAPLHEMNAEDRPVSAQSLFRHDVWWLDCAPPAQTATIRIDWRRLPLPIRDRIKFVAWLAVANPIPARRIKIGSLRRLATSLERLGAWLADRGEDGFGDLDDAFGDDHVAAFAVWAAERAEEEAAARAAGLDDEDADDGRAEPSECAEFVRDGPAFEGDESWLHGGAGEDHADGWDPRYRGVGGVLARLQTEGGVPTPGSVRAIWQAWTTIYDLGPQLSRFGVPPLPARQFGGKGMGEFLRDWGDARERAVAALPDAIWLAVVHGAERMVGVPAADVIRLLGLVLSAMSAGSSVDEAVLAQVGFVFSEVEGEAGAWAPAFAPGREGPARALRALVRLVRDAGLVVLLAEVGLRPSELVSLVGGRKPRRRVRTAIEELAGGDRDEAAAESMPACVVERLSQSGMSVAFYLEGELHKRRRRPLPVDWLLGGRFEQGDEPPAFRAVSMLEDLFAPLRPFADRASAGLLSLDFDPGARATLGMRQLTTSAFGPSMARSIPLFADIAAVASAGGEEFARYARPVRSGVAIAPYQFRKSYAQAVFRIDARLKDAIAQQLKHATVAITDRFYITRDPTLARHMGTFLQRKVGPSEATRRRAIPTALTTAWLDRKHMLPRLSPASACHRGQALRIGRPLA